MFSWMKVFSAVLFILYSPNLLCDTSEPLECSPQNLKAICAGYIEIEPLSTTKNLKVEISLKNIPATQLTVKNTNSELLTKKDYATIIIACVAVIGPILSIIFFSIGRADRLKDKNSESYAFWLKEIAFPDYFQPIIKDLKVLSELFIETQKTSNQPPKSDFIDYWKSHHIELRKMVNNGLTLPYFADIFIELKNRLINLDDSISYQFYSNDELFQIPDKKLLTNSDYILQSKNPFVDTIDYLHSSIYQTQNNN